MVAGEDPFVIWISPHELLKPETKYSITVDNVTSPLFSESFKTLAAADDSPPEAVTPRAEPAERSDSCGASLGARIVWSAIPDGGSAMRYAPVVKAQIARGDEEVELFYDATELSPGRGVLLAAPLDDAHGYCWGRFGLPFRDGGPLRVRLTIFDRAGNPQELDPMDVTFTEDPGAGVCPSEPGGCTTALAEARRPGINASAAAVFVVLGGVVCLRCRRSKKHYQA
jgi:hypothetical protein